MSRNSRIIEITPSVQVTYEQLVKGAAKMDEEILEKFSNEINQIIESRKSNESSQVLQLVKKLHNIIPASLLKRQKSLYSKLQLGVISEKEKEELIVLNEELEKKALERIHLLGKIAALKGVPVTELILSK